MKRLILLLSIVILITAAISVGVSAADEDYVLSGTTFTVYTADGLMEVANLLNSNTSYTSYNVSIANNIDMTGKVWMPIGKNPSYTYNGTINGNGYTISNLTRTEYPYMRLGFIAMAADGATIKDLTLASVNFAPDNDGDAYVGAFIGNIVSPGTVTITNCHVTGTVSTTVNNAGGLVGVVSGSGTLVMSGCTADVDVSAAASSAGALVGRVNGTATITNCTAAGSVSVGNTNLGKFVGAQSGTITMSGCTDNVGYTRVATTFTVYTADGLMDVAKHINGEAGDTTQSYKSYGINIANDIDMTGKTWVPIGKNDTYVYAGTINGNGNTISNLKRVNYTATSHGFIGVADVGVVVKDLELENVNFTANRSTDGFIGGIIGKAKGGGVMTVSNCSVSGTVSTNYHYAGGIVGAVRSSASKMNITNCSFDGDVSAKNYAGGILGDAYNGTTNISGCTVKGDIEVSVNYAGGIVGVMGTKGTRLNIDNCAVSAYVYAKGHSATGIVGGDIAGEYVETDISTYPTLVASNIFVTGHFSAGNRVASFFGYNSHANLSFTNCISLATLEYVTTTENGSFIARDGYSKLYFKNCIAMSDLHVVYRIDMDASVQTLELNNCYLMKDDIGKAATLALYNRNKYYEYNSSATYKYTLIADVIVDGVGATFTPFTVNNTAVRVPIIQYNMPSGTEAEVMARAYSAAMAMFADGSAQESFVHKHTWGSANVKKAATYTSTGISTYACTKCDAVKTVETPCLDSTVTWTYDEGTRTLTFSGNGPMVNFPSANTIPWREYRYDVENVVIGSGVTSICDYAFYDFTALRSVSIPSSVTVIGSFSFHNCRSLKDIALPEGVVTIRNYAFEYCKSLESLNIPSTVTTIGDGILRYSGYATPVITSASTAYTVVGNCIIDVKNSAVIAGVSNSVIPTSGVSVIDVHAFRGCTGLTHMVIPNNITSIEAFAFANCTRLTYLTLPSAITEIKLSTFEGCLALNNVVIPESVSVIGPLAFNGCVGLEKITLPASFSLDVSAFEHCVNIVKAVSTGACSYTITADLGNNEELTDKLIATHNYSGVTCSCGARKPLEVSTVSITLSENIAMNIKVNASYFSNGYTFSKLVITYAGETHTITSLPSASNGYYVFTFDDIYPRYVGKNLTVKLYAKYGSTTYTSALREFSIEDYCYSALNNSANASNTNLKTLVVDLLNYASAAQLYAGYRENESVYISELPNFNLTEEQKGWATQTEPTCSKSASQSAPSGVSSSWTPSVEWKTAALRLENTVQIKLGLDLSALDDISGLYVKATTASNTTGWIIPQSEWVEDTRWYVYFDGLVARQMREDVYFTVYDSNGEPISKTLTYSIEVYIKNNSNSSNHSEETKRLLVAMIIYGDSAYRYFNN